jgi:hypothetical protein
MEEEAKEQ